MSAFPRSVIAVYVWCCRLCYRFSHNVRETSKTNEGVWKETTESGPTLQLSRVAIGKRHKSGISESDVHMPLFSPAARGGNLAKIPPNQVIADFGRGSSVESESE